MAKPVCLWPRPCFFFSFFFFLVLFFVLSSLSPSSSWAACAGIPRPDLGWCPCVRVRALVATSLLLRLRLRLLLLPRPRPLFRPLFCSPSSWGACAGLPRPDLGWCHSLAVRALLATSLSSSSSPSSSSSSSFSSFLLCPRPLLGVRVLVYHVLTWVESQCWGMRCWPRPFVFFLFFFFFFVPPSVALLFLGCVCWYTTS